LVGHDGALYGNTVEGAGGGVVYRLAPQGNGEWIESVLASLGDTAIGDLRMGPGPVYYGTTEYLGLLAYIAGREPGGAWTHAILIDQLPLLFGGVALNKRTGAL
jgi:uncharacterized repeat protein (TIGR03803 family)